MSDPALLLQIAIVPALSSLMPGKMDTVDARVMLLAIALQESRIEHRVQIGGPARGYWQFERAGIAGVLRHHATRPHIEVVCRSLNYRASTGVCYAAVQHNDVLAAVFARLNLWWLPQKLANNVDDGWYQYIEAWRPGKPQPDTWAECYDLATRINTPLGTV